VKVHCDQAGYDIRCEWALEGLNALRATSDAIVIVDVLSFSTAVDIALSRGAIVYPFPWNDESARSFAAKQDALLASKRGNAGGYSLSPVSLCSIPAGTRLVLPSPNGSTLCLGTGGVATFTACLRNAPAVAKRASDYGVRISVIPAGEKWAGGVLRPCLEDLVGAGAVLAEIRGKRSPEAEMAIEAFRRFRTCLQATLHDCGSGRELIQAGFAGDVDMASEYGVSPVVPLLTGGRFADSR
jgi:2-phosphosulfolactate phosphatase